jgi:hypothetical protein
MYLERPVEITFAAGLFRENAPVEQREALLSHLPGMDPAVAWFRIASLVGEWKQHEWDKGRDPNERKRRGPNERKRRNDRYAKIVTALQTAAALIEEAQADERGTDPLMAEWGRQCWAYCREKGIEVRLENEPGLVDLGIEGMPSYDYRALSVLGELFPEALRLLVKAAEKANIPAVKAWSGTPTDSTPPENVINGLARLYTEKRGDEPGISDSTTTPLFNFVKAFVAVVKGRKLEYVSDDWGHVGLVLPPREDDAALGSAIKHALS